MTSLITGTSRLPELEKQTFDKLRTIVSSLSMNFNKAKVLDGMINKMNKRINEKSYEVQNRSSLGKRVGYGFALAALVIIGCGTFPLSIPCLILPLAIFREDSDPNKSPARNFAILCGNLFAKATRSKKQWQASLEKSMQKKIQFQNERVGILNDISALSNKLKNRQLK